MWCPLLLELAAWPGGCVDLVKGGAHDARVTEGQWRPTGEQVGCPSPTPTYQSSRHPMEKELVTRRRPHSEGSQMEPAVPALKEYWGTEFITDTNATLP